MSLVPETVAERPTMRALRVWIEQRGGAAIEGRDRLELARLVRYECEAWFPVIEADVRATLLEKQDTKTAVETLKSIIAVMENGENFKGKAATQTTRRSVVSWCEDALTGLGVKP